MKSLRSEDQPHTYQCLRSPIISSADMHSATMPAKGGSDFAAQIPNPLAFSHMRSGDGNLYPRKGRSTPNRPSIVGTSTDSNTSTSSSTTSSSTYSSIFDDDPSPVGTPPTPLLYDDVDSKRIGGPRASNSGKVSKLSLPGKGLNQERSSGYEHSRESQCPSSPQLGEQNAELDSTELVNDVASRFSHAEIYNASPIPLRVKRRDIKQLAEALSMLDIGSNNTDPRQEPKEIGERVVSDACHRPRPEKQHASSYVTDYPSSKKIKTCSPPSSGASSLSEEIDQQAAPAVQTARPLTSTSTPNKTAKSSRKADLDATTSLAIDRYGHLNDGSGSTPLDIVASSQNPLKGTPKSSLRRKQNADRANRTTDPIAAGVGPASAEKIASSQSIPKTKRAKQETSTLEVVEPRDIAAVMTDEYQTSTTSGEASGWGTDESDYATDADEDVQSRYPQERTCIQPQVGELNSGPTFSDFHEEGLTGKAIRDNIFTLLQYNGKQKVRRPPKVETKSKFGSLYIYTSPMCPNLVKIGMTSGTPHARISQWKGQCKLPIKRLEGLESHAFLHFQLAEKLIQAELHNYRRKYKCHKCHRSHRDPLKVEEKVTKDMVHHGEWYNISEELGLATVQKWRGWFATSRPYNTDGILRPSWASKLERFSKLTATMNTEEWVAEWIQPLKTDEVIPYFWSHSITKMTDTWSDIRNFLSLLLGLLSSLQHIGEKGLDLLPFFGRVTLVLILAFIIQSWINATWAFLFVILSTLMWLWTKF